MTDDRWWIYMDLSLPGLLHQWFALSWQSWPAEECSPVGWWLYRSMWLGWLRNGEWRTEPDFTELWRPRSGFCDFSFLLTGFWRDLKLWKYHENIWTYLGIPRNATRYCYCKYITRTLHEIGIDRPQNLRTPFLKLYNYRDPDFWGCQRSFLPAL